MTLKQYEDESELKIKEWRQKLSEKADKMTEKEQIQMRNRIAAQKSRIKDMQSKKGNEAIEEQTNMEFHALANAID